MASRPSWGRCGAGVEVSCTQTARQFFGFTQAGIDAFDAGSGRGLLLRKHRAAAAGATAAASRQSVPVIWTPKVRGTAGVMLVQVRAVGVWLLNRFLITRLMSNDLSCLPAPTARSASTDWPTTAYRDSETSEL